MCLRDGEGVPSEVSEDEYELEIDTLNVIGDVIEEDNELHIYSNDELKYVIRGKQAGTKGTNVYEYERGSNLKLIGVRHGDYIQNLYGETIATLKDMQMVGELVKVKFLNELNVRDVVNISVVRK